MSEGASQSFYVKTWVVKTTYVMGTLQLVFAIGLAFLERTLGAGPLLPSLFAFGGVLTLYQAHWTSHTPYAKVDSAGVEIRQALLAKPVHVEFRNVRAFARVPPGWLVFLARDGEETRLPLTALADGDADELVSALSQHLTQVSYVED